MKKAALISFLASGILLNEIMPHPSPGNDWVELFNPTTETVNLSGWKLFDTTSSMKNLSGSLDPNSFTYFDVSNRLNNGGDTITLKDQSNQDIDSYSYTGDPGINVSIGRNPDEGSWSTLEFSSKGTPNINTQPSPTPSPSPFPSPSPSTNPTSSFLVSGVPQTIDSTDSFSASVTITNLIASSQYYLKGAFISDGSSNYFGKTQVSGSWIKNSQTYSSQLPITTDSSGGWSGNVTIMPDEDDSGFSGTGNYLFKVAHYLSTGSGLTWSNESSITINQVSQGTSLSEDNSLEIQTSSPTPTVTTTIDATNEISDEENSKAVKIKVRLPDFSSDSAKIAGIATEAATSSALEANFKKGSYFNFPLIAGGVLLGGSFAAMLILKRVGKI